MSDKRKITFPNSDLDSAILSALRALKATNKESSVSINKTWKSVKAAGIGTTHGRVGKRLESLRADGFVGKDKKDQYFLRDRGGERATKLPRSVERSTEDER